MTDHWIRNALSHGSVQVSNALSHGSVQVMCKAYDVTGGLLHMAHCLTTACLLL